MNFSPEIEKLLKNKLSKSQIAKLKLESGIVSSEFDFIFSSEQRKLLEGEGFIFRSLPGMHCEWDECLSAPKKT